MSGDHVGGPDVGWVRTSTLEETRRLPYQLREIIGAYPALGFHIGTAALKAGQS